MPNLAIGLCIGLSAWTICMGSTALSVGSGPKETKILPSFRSKSFTDSKNVKQGSEKLPCIGDLFNEIDWNQKSTQISALENENTEGCISIWWEKETYEGERWRASWNLLLGMRDDKYGIIFSQSIKVDNGKLIFDASFYNLKKELSKWTLITSDIYKDAEKKEIQRNEIKNRMLLPNDNKQSDKWSFNFDTGEICSETNKCTGDSPINTYSSSTWDFVSGYKSGSTIPIYKWFKDIDKLSNFGNDIEARLLKVKGSFELIS